MRRRAAGYPGADREYGITSVSYAAKSATEAVEHCEVSNGSARSPGSKCLELRRRKFAGELFQKYERTTRPNHKCSRRPDWMRDIDVASSLRADCRRT
jgi:hypothetical protein